MRFRQRTEVGKVVDEIIARINQRMRRPMNEVVANFEYIGRLKFRSRVDELQIAAALRERMPLLERGLYSEEQMATLVAAIAAVKKNLTAIARGESPADRESSNG
jgi:hypothetical protein